MNFDKQAAATFTTNTLHADMDLPSNLSHPQYFTSRIPEQKLRSVKEEKFSFANVPPVVKESIDREVAQYASKVCGRLHNLTQ